jgi:hypothetical protein
LFGKIEYAQRKMADKGEKKDKEKSKSKDKDKEKSKSKDKSSTKKKAPSPPPEEEDFIDKDAEIAALDAENEELVNYVDQLEQELTNAGSSPLKSPLPVQFNLLVLMHVSIFR